MDVVRIFGTSTAHMYGDSSWDEYLINLSKYLGRARLGEGRPCLSNTALSCGREGFAGAVSFSAL
jgi:hypothetical protein